jgi:hypothetical protein
VSTDATTEHKDQLASSATQPVSAAPENSSATGEFFPRGAIAFFVAMILGYGVIWLGIYLLLVRRHSGL